MEILLVLDSFKAEADRSWLSRFTPKLTDIINSSGKNFFLLFKGFSYVKSSWYSAALPWPFGLTGANIPSRQELGSE